MNLFKIISYFVLVFIFTGCFRVIPESAVLPKISIDKKFTKSKKIIYHGEIQSVYSPYGGLIVVNKVKSFTFINPDTYKEIKELDNTHRLVGDLPYPIFSKYDEELDKTSLECTDANGVELWKKSFNGKLLNSYDDSKSIIMAIKNNKSITYELLNKISGKLKWSTNNDISALSVSFLSHKNEIYTLVDNSLYKLLSDGKLLHLYDIEVKMDIKKLILKDDLIIAYGNMEENSKDLLEIIDVVSKKIIIKKNIDIVEDSFSDVTVENDTLYIINNKKLSSFKLTNGDIILSKELEITNDSYSTLNDILVYKDKVILIGLSEIYAYGKKDFSLLWKHEELWTPDRLYREEKKSTAVINAASATFYNVNAGQYNAKGGVGGAVGNMHLALSQSSIAENKVLKELNLSKSSSSASEIVFIRGYSTGSLMLEYDAIVYLINLDTGKNQNIQLQERDSYHCYPNVYVDLNNRTIYQSYGTQNLILSCDTLNQLDIIKY